MKLKKILKIAYVSVFFGFLLVMGIASFVIKDKGNGKEKPVELEYSGYTDWSKGFDTYFSANFALRKNFIQLDSQIKYNVFKYTSERGVITGSEGWLFYEDALHDYTGENILSDEDITKIADSIEAMSAKVREQGAKLVFTVAPNKMEIYGEYMPYFLTESKEAGNYEKLMAELEKRDVLYVDMKKVLSEDDTFGNTNLYYKWDSHWNALGASVAYKAIMEAADMAYTDYSDIEYTYKNNFKADLYSMFFPLGTEKDKNYYFSKEESYEYISNYKSDDDLLIETANENGTGEVIFFRDSFGNALYSFFANDFAKADISRALPYDVSDVGDANLVVIEIVERNIPKLIDAYKGDA